MDVVRERWVGELAQAARTVREEPQPSPQSIWDHVYAERK
jgi:2-oxoisovalerate dehydrogenase E1 component alpha subunit